MKQMIFQNHPALTRLLATTCLLLSAGCSYQTTKEREPDPYQSLRQRIEMQSQRFAQQQESLQQSLPRKSPKQTPLQPVLPAYDPLDDIEVSFAIDNENVQHVLNALARETGMNLSLHPDLATEERIIGLHFDRVPASAVLREILRIADLYGEIDGNILRITPYQEKIFHLDFIESNTTASYEVGGDVLGTGGGTASDSLTGNFRLSGGGGASSNPYEVLDTMLRGVLSSNGVMTVNRLAGTLYLKDRPSVIQSAGKLVERFKDMLGRQILIEARILELALSDGYQYGVDWSFLRNVMDSTATGVVSRGITQSIDLTGAVNRSNTPGTTTPEFGLIFSRTTGLGSLLFAVSLLENFGEVHVLSNPTIRARHGQPAMISVGRSNTFIRETTTTTTAATTTTTATTSTEIETDTVFDGLLLGVIPFIGDDGKISLSIHPIKSDVEPDSLQLITIQNSAITLPQVNLKEMSTTIEMQDGETVVLGGLIDDVRARDTDGLPVLSSIPYVGGLFSNDTMTQEVRELVIILKVNQL